MGVAKGCKSARENRLKGKRSMPYVPMLNIAAANEIETLIVNAYACGRQGFQPAQVIELFQKWIVAHPGAIKTIVFAVPRASFDAFDEAFG